ncbi:MAG: FHA domain-containing protein [Steroidobacteraceae bacterium]
MAAMAKERQAQRLKIDCKEPCLGTAPQEWTIGRRAECTIRLDEGDTSEWHAKFVRQGVRWKSIGAISSNGCFVNDLQVGMSYLTSGDCLRFGRVECTFFRPNAGRGDRPPALRATDAANRPAPGPSSRWPSKYRSA